MPVRKFRSLPEYDDSLWIDPNDPRLIPTIGEVWERSRRLCPPAFPPGVYKHRSIEEANRTTERWERETLERAQIRGRRDGETAGR